MHASSAACKQLVFPFYYLKRCCAGSVGLPWEIQKGFGIRDGVIEIMKGFLLDGHTCLLGEEIYAFMLYHSQQSKRSP